MRLLVLSSHFRGIINNLIHRGFFEAFPGEIVWYGPGEQIEPKTTTLQAVLDKVAPDLVLVNMKKRVHHWLPAREIAAIRVPKGIVEVDFCYERDDQWYRDAGVDTVFFRSYADCQKATLSNKAWLPFSIANDWLVYPKERDGRKRLVTFAGNRGKDDIYAVRDRAFAMLWKAKLLEPPAGARYYMDYMRWWRGYLVGLTCGSKFHSTNAKHLIIPAAGAALLTDRPPGTELLFPDATTYWVYKGDCSDLVDVVRSIIEDPTRVLAARRRMHDVLRDRHTHATRWAEVLRTMGLK